MRHQNKKKTEKQGNRSQKNKNRLVEKLRNRKLENLEISETEKS